MEWINATGTFIPAPPVIDGNGDQFSGCFSDVPSSIARYAKIKLNVIGSDGPGHCDHKTGFFNGTIGMLQKNQADYIMLPTGYHAFRGESQCSNSNVLVSTTVDQFESFIISTPTSGDHQLIGLGDLV